MLPSNRSSHRWCSIKKVFLKTSQNLQKKNLCQSLSFNKVGGLRPATLHRRFPVNFTKFSRTSFLQNTSGQLHLK